MLSSFNSLVIEKAMNIKMNLTITILEKNVNINSVKELVLIIIPKPTTNKSMFMLKITNHIANPKTIKSSLCLTRNSNLSLIDIDLLLYNKLIITIVKPIIV